MARLEVLMCGRRRRRVKRRKTLRERGKVKLENGHLHPTIHYHRSQRSLDTIFPQPGLDEYRKGFKTVFVVVQNPKSPLLDYIPWNPDLDLEDLGLNPVLIGLNFSIDEVHIVIFMTYAMHTDLYQQKVTNLCQFWNLHHRQKVNMEAQSRLVRVCLVPPKDSSHCCAV